MHVCLFVKRAFAYDGSVHIRLCICTDNGKAKNVVYSQFLRSLTPANEMNACLKNSNLWAHVKILKLTTNMRVRLQNDDSGQTFSDQLLAIGNGKLPVVGKPKMLYIRNFYVV